MNNETNKIHGYKVFASDWSCLGKQYACPGTFKSYNGVKLCNHGMHFCLKLTDCFNYYAFNPENHVAEVIAHGQIAGNGNKCCTDELEVVRELSWSEVLEMVNRGKGCTGFGNRGDYNRGSCNSGDHNSGCRNSGDWNGGDGNRGDSNGGDGNIGSCNSGDYNIGYMNKGNGNRGDMNSGNYNVGDYNTGNYNRGNYNAGDWNKCDFSNGCFNTVESKMYLFNKPSDWTYQDWLSSDAWNLLKRIPINTMKWVFSSYMTDEEKAEHPEHETTGGYLKALDESDDRQTWWDGLSEPSRNIIKSLPNFDEAIFYEITGIKVS